MGPIPPLCAPRSCVLSAEPERAKIKIFGGVLCLWPKGKTQKHCMCRTQHALTWL